MPVNCSVKLSAMLLFCACATAILRCGLVGQNRNKGKYYRVKTCKRYNGSIIARANYNTLARCLSLAREKNGLAFNFSPLKPSVTNDDDDEHDNEGDVLFVSSCEILGCPDVDNFTGLVNDTKFDYYTLYGNAEAIYNASCIPTIGIFQVNPMPVNYSQAEDTCRSDGGTLAHIVSERRTTGLSQIVGQRVLHWYYQAAYVGLSDVRAEGVFVTARDEPLNCFPYRAWAPGHPRPSTHRNDCVIIDTAKVWRAIGCDTRMPFICEIAARPPFWREYQTFGNVSCASYRNRTMRRFCTKIKRKYRRGKRTFIKYRGLDESRCEED